MEQNIVNLGFGTEEFTVDQRIILDGLEKVYQSAVRLDGMKIAPGVDPSWKELRASIKAQEQEIKQLQAANVAYIKSQEAVTKAETDRIKQLQEEEKLQQQQSKTRKMTAAEKEKASAQSAREKKQSEDLANDYIQLSKAYNDAALKAKNYYITLGSNHPVTVQAVKDAADMRASLYAAEQAVGQSQRNVGNYASGWQSFNMVIRETPNFAISAQTGIQSLSNNIPMFADEIKKARGEGKSWMTILKELGKNLFSFGGIATIATIALTALPKILAAMTSESEKAAKKQKTFAEVQSLATKEANSERIELEALLLVARTESKSRQERLAAVKAINDIMPDYLGNIRLESINTDGTNKIIDAYVDQLQKKALAQAYISKIQDKYGALLDNENSSIQDNIQWYEQLWVAIKNGNNPTIINAQILQQGTINRLKANKSIQEEIRLLQEKFNADLKSGKAIMDLDKIEKQRAKNVKKNVDESAKFELELYAITYKAIADNAENSELVRAMALSKYFYYKTKIMEEDARKDKDSAKEVALRRLKIEIEYNQSVQKLFAETAAKRKKAREQVLMEESGSTAASIQKEQIENDKISLSLINMQVAAYQELVDKLKSGKISLQEYGSEKERIDGEISKRSIRVQISALEQIAALQRTDADAQTKTNLQIAALKKQLSQEDVDGIKKSEEQKAQIRQKGTELSFATLDLLQTAITAQYENEKNRIQELIDLSDERYQKEIENVRASTLSEVDKAARIKILEQEQAARRREYEKEIREQNIKKAKADRAFQVFQVVGNTAIGVTSALAQFPPNPILAAIIGAIGAVQIAKILATPIPKYATGTDNHPGGFSIYGEAGPEMVKEPGKSARIVDTATLGYLAPGTQVTPLSDLVIPMAQIGADRMAALRMAGQSVDNGEAWAIAKWQAAEYRKAMGRGRKLNVNVTLPVTMGGYYINKQYGRS